MKRKLIIFLSLAASLSISCWVDMFPNPDEVKYDATSFNRLTNDILSQSQIFQMDDFTRYYKKLNGKKNIRLTKERDPNDDYSKYLDSVVNEEKIDIKILNNLRAQLEKTKLRDFSRSNDSILFKVDGNWQVSFGYFYCKRGTKGDSSGLHFMNH